MCERKTLSQNKFGYINYCSKSKALIIEMGNNHLKLQETTFDGFKNAFIISNERLQKSSRNRVYIETPLEGFAMTFSAYELKLCLDLIEQAEAEFFVMQAHQIINQFA